MPPSQHFPRRQTLTRSRATERPATCSWAGCSRCPGSSAPHRRGGCSPSRTSASCYAPGARRQPPSWRPCCSTRLTSPSSRARCSAPTATCASASRLTTTAWRKQPTDWSQPSPMEVPDMASTSWSKQSLELRVHGVELHIADRAPDRVLTFTDIEGNVAPEDCFLSRQIFTHGTDDATAFLAAFAARSLQAAEYSSALYGARVLTTVDPHVVRPVFESMVDLSDTGDLLTKLTELPMPRMFMHGQQNAHLSYLPELRRQGVEVTEIEHSGHWPMYSNPPAMWTALHAFLTDRVQPQE